MSTTRFSRAISSAGSQRKLTISAWVKRVDLGQSTGIYCSSNSSDAANLRGLFFASNDSIQVGFYNGGYDMRVETDAVFRDIGAWYHVVISINSEETTTEDRVKIWVNNVQQTSMQVSDYPSTNEDFDFFGTTISQYIGSLRAGGVYSASNISHLYVTDGYNYTPSTFGETDATTGEWKIIADPTIANYGTNGFFLFKNNASATDQSGNGNNFTVSSGTATQTEDNPSNNFNTWNLLDDFYEGGSFTNGNTTYQTNSSNYSRNSSTLGMTSGKYYWEIKPSAVNTAGDFYPIIGVSSSQISGTGDFLGKRVADYGFQTNPAGDYFKWNNNSSSSWGEAYVLNDVISVALDLDNNKIYFGKNGTWLESGDPTSGSTGTGAAYTVTAAASTPLGVYFPSVCNYDGTGNVTFQANFGNGYFGTSAVSSAGTNASNNGVFEYDVPTGYTALSTKGLNL